MKKVMIVCLAFLILAQPIKQAEAAHNELIHMVSVVESKNLDVDQWEVTFKEKINEQRAKEIIKLLENKYELTSKQQKNSVLYSFGNSHNHSELVESYTVVIPKHKHGKIELIVELKGNTWDSAMETEYFKWQSFVTDLLLTEKARAYTCLTTEFNGIINSDYFQRYIINELDITQIQTQTDKVKNSTLEKVIYGYTSLWKQEINIKDIPMNFQMAVDTNELGELQFIIGTPILINEY